MSARSQPLPRRTLGRTGVGVSVVSLGAGPVAGLMTGQDRAAQEAVVRRAIERGINWIDTAAGYGQGTSERNLGQVLAAIPAAAELHVATKVRVEIAGAWDPAGDVRRSVAASLTRLGRDEVTLLQLHNAITPRRGDEPASLAVDDVLGPAGVLEALQIERSAGRTRFLGLTGTGHPEALRHVIESGQFDTVQVPFHLLNSTAARRSSATIVERGYGQLLDDCRQQCMGVFAIRVFAAGAILGAPPSAHTRVTQYFPLEEYERDRRRAEKLARVLPAGQTVKELALRYVLSQPAISSAIVGLATPEQVDEVADVALLGPLDERTLRDVETLVKQLG